MLQGANLLQRLQRKFRPDTLLHIRVQRQTFLENFMLGDLLAHAKSRRQAECRYIARRIRVKHPVGNTGGGIMRFRMHEQPADAEILREAVDVGVAKKRFFVGRMVVVNHKSVFRIFHPRF